MAFLSDNVLDSGLSYITTNADRLDICYTQEPANYTEATSTYTCGDENSPSVGSPTNGDSSGRKVVLAAISAGDVTDTQTAGWWALSYTGNTELLAANSLSSTQAVTSGNTFSLTATDITIPDPS